MTINKIMKKSIGIEIGTNFIRAIILSKKHRKFKIIKVLKENWNWKDGDELPDSFKDILIKEKSPVYLSIPKSLTFFRPASFPFRSRKKILLAIPYEIEESMPLPVEQFNFDFYFMSLRGTKCRGNLITVIARHKVPWQSHKTKVMVIAISQENIKKILTPFEKIGVKILSLEVNSITLFNLCFGVARLVSRRAISAIPDKISSLKKVGNLLLLYLTQEEATLDIVQNRILTESRAVSFSNKEELFREIILTKKAFFGKETLKKILLVGNPDLKNELEKNLNIPIISPDFAKLFKLSPISSPPRGETPPKSLPHKWGGKEGGGEFSLAFGLALKRFIHFPLNINLMPEKKKRKILLPKKVIASLSIILFLLVIIFPLFSLKKRQQEYRLLKRQINEISKSLFPSLKGTMPLKELKRKLKGQGSEKIAILLEKEKSPLETLKRFSAIIPENLRIEVKNITIDRKILTISANLPSLKDIDELKRILKNSSYFEGIKIGEMRLNKEKGKVEFGLNLKIK